MVVVCAARHWEPWWWSFAQPLVVLLKTRTQGGIEYLQRDGLGQKGLRGRELGEPVISAGGREK